MFVCPRMDFISILLRCVCLYLPMLEHFSRWNCAQNLNWPCPRDPATVRAGWTEKGKRERTCDRAYITNCAYAALINRNVLDGRKHEYINCIMRNPVLGLDANKCDCYKYIIVDAYKLTLKYICYLQIDYTVCINGPS